MQLVVQIIFLVYMQSEMPTLPQICNCTHTLAPHKVVMSNFHSPDPIILVGLQ